MEMPKSCWECKLTDKKQPPKSCIFKSWYTLSRDDKPSTCNWCPLIYIPPHGRLIDGDALYKESHERCLWWAEDYELGDMLDDIHNAPTIIESEGEE